MSDCRGILGLILMALVEPAGLKAADELPGAVAPLLAKYCNACHSGGNHTEGRKPVWKPTLAQPLQQFTEADGDREGSTERRRGISCMGRRYLSAAQRLT